MAQPKQVKIAAYGKRSTVVEPPTSVGATKSNDERNPDSFDSTGETLSTSPDIPSMEVNRG